MGLRDKFEGRIKAKQQEIQELKTKIREAEGYIQAMQDTLKMLPREETAHSQGQKPDRIAIRKGSNIEKAYHYLKRVGEPQHISEILKAIGKTPKDRAALGGTLSWYVRKDAIFTRPDPGTFGLKEWKAEKTAELQFEPPVDFGLEPKEESTSKV
jgi:hypothetical protein